MTDREAEILAWIKENPMISQQEIAERANIARSSVAVHISNLMKKGKIQGKGYVVKEDAYITVIGGITVDFNGRSLSPLVDRDSNPGEVRVSIGGVGRNIAENICRLGTRVEMLTALADDMYTKSIQDSCGEIGISLAHALHLPGEATSSYLCINDHNGDMKLALSDTKIYKKLDIEYIRTKLDLINGSELVVVDTNINADVIEFLAKNCKVPLLADTVSTKKAEKLLPVLSYLHTIKPNRIEAEILSGVPIIDETSLQKAADALIAKGIRQVFISLSADGVFYADSETSGILPCYTAEAVSTTGCGDAFMGALAWGIQKGLDIETLAKCGLAAATACIGSPTANNPTLSETNVYEMIYS